MLSKYLNSATFIAAAIGMSAPLPVVAQQGGDAFGCIAPNGKEVQDGGQLAEALNQYIRSEDIVPLADGCSLDAYAQLSAADADALTAALANAPAQMRDQLLPMLDAAPAAETAAATEGAEAPTEEQPQQADNGAAEATAPAEAEVADNAEATSEPQTEPTATAEENTQPPVTTAETEAQTAEAEATTGSEALAEAVKEAQGEGAKAQEQAEASTPVTSGMSRDDEGADQIAADTNAAEAQAEAEQTAAADAAPSDAGEAGGTQLTDEERQARDNERAAEAVANAAAGADAGGDEVAQESEVTTEVVTEETVRRSDEEFDAPVTGDIAATEEKKGLSNFEKALLIGLGGAVVGSLLDNGDEVVSNTGDRVVVERDGELRILKNDDALLQRPGAEVQTRTFNDGSSRTTVNYDDGSQIVTVRAADGRVLRRTYVRAEDGEEVVLFDDTQTVEQVDFAGLPTLEEIRAKEKAKAEVTMSNREELDRALQRALLADVDRRFSLQQVRDYKRVRALAPPIELDAVTFATGSAAIEPTQAEALVSLGQAMKDVVEKNPGAVFLVEGHTDAIGQASYNLALSDRRAETVALALTEYFKVPPQNLVIQGYGETDLKIGTLDAERANRRAVVRNITALLR